MVFVELVEERRHITYSVVHRVVKVDHETSSTWTGENDVKACQAIPNGS